MKLKRTHIVGDPRQIQFQKIVEWVLKLDDSMVVPIIHIDNYQGNHCLMQRRACAFNTKWHISTQSTITTRLKIYQNTKKNSLSSLNSGVFLKVFCNSPLLSEKINLQLLWILIMCSLLSTERLAFICIIYFHCKRVSATTSTEWAK
jgi:hypothetical protein